MPAAPDTLEEIRNHFGGASAPLVFQRLSVNEASLSALWRQYQSVMLGGEIDRPTKELIGLSVAIAKSNDYVVALQRRQIRRVGLETPDETEALAVAGFFEGFDAFAHALHVDSDIRLRRLEAGDMSLIDREIDVNVPYVLQSDNAVVNDVYTEIRTTMGIPFVPNIFKALAHQPEMLQAKWESYKAIMLGGRLRRRTKELIAVAVSAVNGCFY